MRTNVLAIIAVIWPSVISAQETIQSTIIHDDLVREFILYVPASYDGSQNVPLLFNFHGAGGNAAEQMEWGDFRPIADTAGFLVVHPQGTGTEGAGFWNIGEGADGVDDIGFTEALIDSISDEYSIDANRVYATGKSNGGFFSILLAGQLSEKIAAIASVSGTMTQSMFDNMSPTHPTPFLHIHGTGDLLVPYDVNPLYLSVSDVLNYWIDYNNCDITPIVTQLQDVDPDDGSTVEHYLYEFGDNCVAVEHLKVLDGGHSWPGSSDPYPGTNFDIDGSVEIWNFLSRYDINGLIGCTLNSTNENSSQEKIKVYPNPFQTTVSVSGLEHYHHVIISDASGRVIIQTKETTIDLSHLNSGMYFIRVEGDPNTKVQKLIKL